MGTRWIIEGTIDERWPINTRGNVGEVFPEVITALGYELGVLAAERAWRRSYLEIGIAAESDFAGPDPVIIGLYGGYAYLNLSYLRIMGVRAPGSSAAAIDVSFFGEGDPPPYEARPGDKNIRCSLRILRTVLSALRTRRLPPVVADSVARAAAFEAKRPSLDAPDDELLGYLLSFPDAFEPVFANHMTTSAVSAIVSGILADACASADRPGLVTHLIGASGDVMSARYSRDLYEVAKLAQASPAVTAAFDNGMTGLDGRLRANESAQEFCAAFDHFVATHGHRGPNDWELSSRTWENTPELALVAINAMRQAEHDLDPAARLRDDEAKRVAAVAEVRPHLKLLDRGNFDKAVTAIAFWSQAREATRDRAVRLILPAKQVYRELVRRGAERGGDADPVAVALLSPIDELGQYLADPTSFAETLSERMALYRRFDAVEPRFFIAGPGEVPTLEELEAERQATAAVAEVGTVLSGAAGSSGVARGRVRVVLDPADAGELHPGEVLVAPLTDPSWTPLFLPAAAVVVNVGALMSHAVIVARELGIACVVAVEGATDRLVDGMEVEVDGTAGTITVISV